MPPKSLFLQMRQNIGSSKSLTKGLIGIANIKKRKENEQNDRSYSVSRQKKDLLRIKEDVLKGKEDVFKGKEDVFKGKEDIFKGKEDKFIDDNKQEQDSQQECKVELYSVPSVSNYPLRKKSYQFESPVQLIRHNSYRAQISRQLTPKYKAYPQSSQILSPIYHIPSLNSTSLQLIKETAYSDVKDIKSFHMDALSTEAEMSKTQLAKRHRIARSETSLLDQLSEQSGEEGLDRSLGLVEPSPEKSGQTIGEENGVNMEANNELNGRCNFQEAQQTNMDLHGQLQVNHTDQYLELDKFNQLQVNHQTYSFYSNINTNDQQQFESSKQDSEGDLTHRTYLLKSQDIDLNRHEQPEVQFQSVVGSDLKTGKSERQQQFSPFQKKLQQQSYQKYSQFEAIESINNQQTIQSQVNQNILNNSQCEIANQLKDKQVQVQLDQEKLCQQHIRDDCWKNKDTQKPLQNTFQKEKIMVTVQQLGVPNIAINNLFQQDKCHQVKSPTLISQSNQSQEPKQLHKQTISVGTDNLLVEGQQHGSQTVQSLSYQFKTVNLKYQPTNISSKVQVLSNNQSLQVKSISKLQISSHTVEYFFQCTNTTSKQVACVRCPSLLAMIQALNRSLREIDQ